jgi:hypothetical protein
MHQCIKHLIALVSGVSAHVAKAPRLLAALRIKILHARTPTMRSQFKTG